ncbi:unnamed protein product [Linum trigynum]|uniref:Expansin-like EG45 domain-containing protein n=1 Tax=Linum trigynum TaxID=586398 RepID=A0AAV2EI85_9ROSI
MATPRRLHHLTAVLVAVAAFCLLSGHPCAGKEKLLATFYTPPYIPSKCYGNDEHGVMVAAADQDTLWDGGNACGKRYRVKCLHGTNKGVDVPCKAGRSVTVKIVDLCPSGCRGNIDLSAEAFKHIADPDEGKIVISLEEL